MKTNNSKGSNQTVNYSIGLDIGTTSVGWAVTDDNSRLLKKGNQHLWGYDLFEEAKTAAERRVFRGTRRRYKRRRQRVKLLQDILSPMVYEADPMFFKRLDNSYLIAEDREKADTGNSGNIFFQSVMSDREYYEKYPTIYHLRKALAENGEKADPRLVYLALHHIVKYRGNFLYEGQDLNKAVNSTDASENLQKLLSFITDNSDANLSSINAEEMLSILLKQEVPGTERRRECQSLINDKDAKNVVKEIAGAILGYKFNVEKVFGIVHKDVKFSDTDIAEAETEIESLMGDNYEYFMLLEGIYSFAVLKNILSNSDDMSISSNMVAIYDRHAADLKLTKDALKEHKDEYHKVFDDDGIYQKFIKSPSKMPRDEFYKSISNILKGLEENDLVKKIQDEIASETYMPRQNSISNVAIPYQLHLAEMKKIIDNQSKYYSCINTNRGKLMSLVSFRIPYYVGPLVSNSQNHFAWMIRNDDSTDPIRSWNWEEKIDLEKTAEAFIKRMQNHCSYLLAEETLPKNSILLNRFNVMNELVKVRLNDHYFTAKTREQIINNLFLRKNDVAEKDLKKWLVDNQFVTSLDECVITGLNDGKFSNGLKSEIKFRQIFADDFDTRIDDIELLIEWITVYNNKDILRSRISKTFTGDRALTEQQLNSVLSIQYTGYGRFSRKLINGLVSRNQTGFVGTIMEFLKESDKNENFMQIINNPDYGFMQQIEDENEVDDGRLSYSQVAELPGSPALKRGIWQSIRVVQDIVGYMKHDPEKIYIEFARNEGEKVRTYTRYRQLEKIYKEYLGNSDIHKELASSVKNLDNDRLYLYFMQQGKCMYSGMPLDIRKLETYQIDHILPQSYIKDDSIENKALVYSEQNQRKADSLLLDDAIVKRQYVWWKSLLDMNLIGSKKFHNLTRRTITEQEQAGFIARQLVETRQISVHVRNILAGYYKNTKVKTVHAPLSSECRRKFELYKIRDLNSVHHAQDAYLACVIGQFISNRFPYLGDEGKIAYRYVKDDIISRIKEGYANRAEGSTIKDEHIMYSYVINQMRSSVLTNRETGEVFWSGEEQIEYMKKIFNYKDYFYNYQTHEDDGKLYNATIYSRSEFAKDPECGTAIKKLKPVEKYGGYKSLEKAYGLAIEYTQKKKVKRIVVSVPVLYLQNTKSIEDYLCLKLNADSVTVIKKIPLGQTFVVDGCLYTMSSPEEWQVRQQIFLSEEDRNILYRAIYRKTKPTSEELTKLFFDLLKKIYTQSPALRSKINSALCCCVGFEKNELNIIENQILIENIKHLYFDGGVENQISQIQMLLNSMTVKGGSKLAIGSMIVIPSQFGRFNCKVIDLDKAVWIYTSASGIYRKVIKL